MRVIDTYEPGDERAGRGRAPGAVTSQELHRLAVRPLDRGLIDPSRWPSEPATPADIDAERFARAIAAVCPRERVSDVAYPIASGALRAGARFGVDPFLLAALAQQQSGCDATRRNGWGVGLTRIHPALYRAGFVGTEYRYPRGDGRGGFTLARIALPDASFDTATLLEPEANLHFAAAFLSAWEAACPALDAAYPSRPHRHAVSHFIFGDLVRSTGPEDAIFTVRRRLIERYGGRSGTPAAFVSPLGGAPRLAISGPGDPRDGGARIHRGVDFVSQRGEAVVAIAAGTVVAAGVDRGEGPLVSAAATEAAGLRPLGPRGLAVEVAHAGGLRSLYVHLEAYKVNVGDEVVAGQLLGYVGRSGMHASPAHLHLGIFRGETALDPRDVLGAQLLGPELSRRWWSTMYPRLVSLGLPVPYPRPPGVEPAGLRSRSRAEGRRRRPPETSAALSPGHPPRRRGRARARRP